MGEERYFDNPYPDYTPELLNPMFDQQSKMITNKFKTKLKTHVGKLYNAVEAGRRDADNKRDRSVYTGSAGYIYLNIHLLQVLQKENYLNKALEILENIRNDVKKQCGTFLCGEAGPLALFAVVYHKREMKKESTTCIERLLEFAPKVLNIESDIADEILYGRCGYLFGLLFVKKSIPGESKISEELIYGVIKSILDSGRKLSASQKCSSPLLYQWHDKYYLGAAHGMAGILFMLLQVRDRLTDDELTRYVKPSIDWMLKHIFPSGNLASSVGSNNDRLVHWCHGAPGAIFLFALAYKTYQDDKYLNAAENCASVIWRRGLLKKGHGLCHGTAGNAYGFIYLYQITKDNKYMYYACQFADWCCAYEKHNCRTADRPYSLYEGLSGNLFFISDMINASEAKFPGYVI